MRGLPIIAAAVLGLATGQATAAPARLETAVIAGGCFWGVEAVFEHVKGVHDVVSGYAGGRAADANYRAVSSERTGHAEAVRIRFDPAKISYAQLLKIHAIIAHDPTQVNRQGPDTGASYRSVIFPQNAGQRQVAGRFLALLSKSRIYRRQIATRLEEGRFFPAEAYHQDFVRRNPRHGYVVVNDLPKLAKLRRTFPQHWRA